jgi:hypothetical protein
MNVFVSYSIDVRNRHLITLLIDELNSIDVKVSSSNKLNGVDSIIKIYIQRADLFIGIMSVKDGSNNRVLAEWEIAKQVNRPYIIVLEQGFVIEGYENDPRIITFNINNLDKALLDIKKIIDDEKSSKSTATAMAVVLGGTALYGLFQILNQKKRRKR